jgi:hypothetical protein
LPLFAFTRTLIGEEPMQKKQSEKTCAWGKAYGISKIPCYRFNLCCSGFIFVRNDPGLNIFFMKRMRKEKFRG